MGWDGDGEGEERRVEAGRTAEETGAVPRIAEQIGADRRRSEASEAELSRAGEQGRTEESKENGRLGTIEDPVGDDGEQRGRELKESRAVRISRRTVCAWHSVSGSLLEQ